MTGVQTITFCQDAPALSGQTSVARLPYRARQIADHRPLHTLCFSADAVIESQEACYYHSIALQNWTYSRSHGNRCSIIAVFRVCDGGRSAAPSRPRETALVNMSAAKKTLRIAYRALYLLLYIVLVALLLAVPADVIRQAVINNQTFNILVIAISYILTVLIVSFIYATRLYINRSVLASIPKPWIPVEKGDLKKQVRNMIAAGLSRSAAIAYAARPRVAPVFPGQAPEGDREETQNGGSHKEKAVRPFKLKKTVTVEDEMGISLPPVKAVWGDIEHPGWVSPTSPDLPDLQYSSVISELPNLIEAKAISLTPPDPESKAEPPLLDPEAVSLLQRTEEMGLRDYLTHLMDLGVLETSTTTADFIAKYEHARFSTRPLSNMRFRELMHLFAGVLRNMKPLDPAVLAALVDGDSDDGAPPESDIDNDGPLDTNPSTPGNRHGHRTPESNVSRSASSSTNSSRVHRTPNLPGRNSSANTWQQYRTAPTTPKSKRTAISRSSSSNTFAQTRHPYPASQASSGSLRSDTAGSVIRLSERGDPPELPYVLTPRDTTSG